MSELPSGWVETTLGELSIWGSGGTPSRSNPAYFGGEIPWVTISDLSDGVVSSTFASITEVGLENSAAKLAPVGSILVALYGSIGKLGIAGVPLTTNQAIAYSLPNEGAFDSKYLFHYLHSERGNLLALGSGVTQKNIYLGDIKVYRFPLPPRAEQTRIVEKLEELLSDLDAGVAELKAAQKKLGQYRQSLLKAAVEGALTAEWRKQNVPFETGAQLLDHILLERRARWEAKQLAKFKEQGKPPLKDWQKKYPEPVQPDTTNLPALPEGWFYSYLETFIPSDKTGTKTGPFGSLLMKREHQLSGVPVIGIENIDRVRFIEGSKIHISQEKAEELSDYDLKEGDVVISRSGTVGEVCVIPASLGEARFSTNIMRVRLNLDVMLPEFFCMLFSGSPFVLKQVTQLCSGSTRDFLNTEILKTLIFAVPPISEQAVILSAVQEKSLEIDRLQASLLNLFKQSTAQRQNILRAAFAGQLVPQDPTDEPASVLLERIRAERAAHAAVNKPRGRKVRATTA